MTLVTWLLDTVLRLVAPPRPRRHPRAAALHHYSSINTTRPKATRRPRAR